MRVTPYQPEHLAGVYEVYRQTMAALPHGRFMPSRERVGRALAEAAAGGAGILVAEDGGAARGVATFGRVTPEGQSEPVFEITGLFAPDEGVLAQLLQLALEHAGDARRVVAFPAEHGHCPLAGSNGGWDGLSDRLRPAARVLARHGFAPFYRELHLECGAPLLPDELPPPPAGLTLVQGGKADSVSYRAMAGDEEVGICIAPLMSRVSDHPEAGSWGYVAWLHVEEPYRRRGLARILIVETLRRMVERGCRGFWLTTGSENFAAQPLYLSLGFEIVDASSCWQRTRA